MNTRSTANSTTTESSSEQVRYVKMVSSVLYYMSYESDFFFLMCLYRPILGIVFFFSNLILLMVTNMPKLL